MTEVKNVMKRLMTLLLVFAMVITLVPLSGIEVKAATSGTVNGLADSTIELSYSGTAENAWSASGATIIGTTQNRKDTGGSC